MVLYIILWALALLAILVVWLYNKLVAMKNTVDGALADVDVQMKMRFDLVDNLVNTVKWYATHEKETLEKIVSARNAYMSASWPAEKADANNQLTGMLKSVFALAEAYPDLKANAWFVALQWQLAEIEDKIASARRYFNATIKEYNTSLQSFPNNIVAWLFGFKNEQDYFTVTTEEEKQAPKVQF